MAQSLRVVPDPRGPTLTKHLRNHTTHHWAKTNFFSLLRLTKGLDPPSSSNQSSTTAAEGAFRGGRDPSPGHLDQQVDKGIGQWQLGDTPMVRLHLPDLHGRENRKQEDNYQQRVCFLCKCVLVHACVCARLCARVSHLLVLRQQFQQLFQGFRPVRLTVAMANIIHDHLIGSAAVISNNAN